MAENACRLLAGLACLLSVELDLVTAAEAQFANVPGHVLMHGPATSGGLVASPAIAIMPNGDYIAKAE